MTRMRTVRRLVAAIFVLGVYGTLAAAQPQRPPIDPLAEARARQTIADQKAEREVLEAMQLAERTAKSNPVKAIQALKTAQINVDLSAALSTDARRSLTDRLQRKIAALEGRPLPVVEAKHDPKANTARFDRRAAFESYAAEIKAVNEGVQRFAKLKQSGQNAEADRELAGLARAFPNNPAVIRLQDRDTFASRVEDSVEFGRLMGRRITLALQDVDRAALPAIRDVEFPKDWAEKTKRRTTGVQLSAKEKKIIEALDRPISVDWNSKMTEEVLQELSTAMDQNLFIDKKSLTDLGAELNKPTTLRANGVSARTVLRQVLAAQGLTFVVKDEAIQVVTVEKARDMLITRVYYLGDLVQGIGPFGGSPQWGTFLDFQQTMSNVDLLVKSIESSVDPLSWKERGGAGTITFHVPSMSIIVRASAEVHATLGSKMGAGR